MITSRLRQLGDSFRLTLGEQLALFVFVGVFLLTFTNPARAQDVFRSPRFSKTGDNVAKTASEFRSIAPTQAHLASEKLNRIKQDQEPDSIENWLPGQDDAVKEIMPAPSNQDAEEVVPIETTDPRSVDSAGSGSSQAGAQSNREVIIQRYPDGKPQTVRQIIQDENGNYVNDGYWRVLSQANEKTIIAQGQYKLGKMEGVWMRKHAKESGGLLSTKPFNMYQGPFTSIAIFEENQLNGIWSINDVNDQKIFEVPYKQGMRHGTASWWYPAQSSTSQNKMREVTFRDGVIHGRLREWDEQKKMTRDDEYVDGQRVVRNTTYYRPKQKQSENYYLDAKLELDGSDDWWKATPAQLVAKGSRIQHGPVSSWYDNGLPKMNGVYEQGQRSGKFTWWHANGNKQLEGSYKAGKKLGRWTWWHSNGMKASAGVYEDDVAVGEWIWWNTKGAVEDRKQFDKASGASNENESGEPEQLPPMGNEDSRSIMDSSNESLNKSGENGTGASGKNSEPGSIIEMEGIGGLDEMMDQNNPQKTPVPTESKPEVSPPSAPGLLDPSTKPPADSSKTDPGLPASEKETSGGEQQYIESLFG